MADGPPLDIPAMQETAHNFVHRPRFERNQTMRSASLKTLLLAIPVLTIVQWVTVLEKRSQHFRELTLWWREAAGAEIGLAEHVTNLPLFIVRKDIPAIRQIRIARLQTWSNSPEKQQHAFHSSGWDASYPRDWVKQYLVHIEYCERLAMKYEKAAKSPWLPVAPDAQEPGVGL